MNRSSLLISLLALAAGATPWANAGRDRGAPRRAPRMLEPGSPLARAYHEATRTIQGCEGFIRQHPGERDLCAGALLRIARLHERRGRHERALEAYEKAIDEYGDEAVPGANTDVTVKDLALFSTGLLYKKMGQRDKALEILDRLTTKAQDSNIRGGARIHYLEIKQSHLKLDVTVRIRAKGPYAVGGHIPGSLVIENHTKETVICRWHAQMRKRSYRVTAPRSASKELALLPGARCEKAFVFTHTNGLVPGEYRVTGGLTGVPFRTNTVVLRLAARKQ